MDNESTVFVGTLRVIVKVVGNGHGDPSSNSDQGCLHFK